MAQCFAMNVVANIKTDDPDIRSAVLKVVADGQGEGRQRYDLRMAKSLLENWKVNLEEYNITFEW
jgi:hypothetical protein